jgi:hypothetical protein
MHVGIREAARQAAVNLPPQEQERFVFRVLRRASRQQWLSKAKASTALALSPSTGFSTQASTKPLSAPVLNGADSVANSLKDDEIATKVDLSRAIRKGAKVFGESDGETVIAKSEDLRRVVSSAAQIHGWDSDKGRTSVEFKILNAGGNVSLSVSNPTSDD